MKGNRPKATFRTALVLVLIAFLSVIMLKTPSGLVKKLKSIAHSGYSK
jgi:hypothetical protein